MHFSGVRHFARYVITEQNPSGKILTKEDTGIQTFLHIRFSAQMEQLKENNNQTPASEDVFDKMQQPDHYRHSG